MTTLSTKIRLGSLVALAAILFSLAVLPFGGSSTPDVSGAATCPINPGPRVRGSTTLGPISDNIKPQYQVTWPNRTQVNSNPWEGSGGGITAIRNGTADVGQSSRALTAAEAAGLYVYRVGRDGMVMAVSNSGNMGFISNITTAQVKSIYESGYTGATWDDYGLGGPAVQIVMRSRITTSGTYPDFISLFGISGGSEVLTINNSGLPRLQESEDMANAAAAADYVIAYTSIANLGVPNLKALQVDGVTPNKTTVANGAYPKLRTLHYMLRENSTSATGTPRIDNSNIVAGDDFINLIGSATGSAIIDVTGFVPILPAQTLIPDQDVDMDGVISIGDLGAITSKWGLASGGPGCQGWIRADVNNSANVSLGDAGSVFAAWNNPAFGFIPPVYP